MLHLVAATDPAWGEIAANDLLVLLRDHADCELKAAANAMSLAPKLGRYPEFVRQLVDLAKEELEHYALVAAELERLGESVEVPQKNPYPEALRLAAARVRRVSGEDSEDRAFLDRLLVAAMVEARSCERFGVLAKTLEARGDARMARFYQGLMESEAKHHRLFTAMAEVIAGPEETWRALALLAKEDGEIAKTLGKVPRMHG